MRIQEVKKVFAFFFLLGFFVGIIYVNLYAKTYITSMGIFSDYFLEQFSGENLHVEEYIVFITGVRVFPILFLAILSGTRHGKAAGSVYLLWTGFSGGLILTTAILKLNVKGIFLCLVALMPHFICYIAAYIMLLLYIFTYPDVRWNHSKTVSMILFILMGIITECYLNPVLMDIFLKRI